MAAKLKGCITHSRAGHYIASLHDVEANRRVWKSHKLSTLYEARRQLGDERARREESVASHPA